MVKEAPEWTEECEEALQKLSKELEEKALLKCPDKNRPFILYTDYSSIGLGAVLSQEDDKGIERPVLYLSRSCRDAETRYSSAEGEALAALWALE